MKNNDAMIMLSAADFSSPFVMHQIDAMPMAIAIKWKSVFILKCCGVALRPVTSSAGFHRRPTPRPVATGN